jgi:LacI family transcriptional regulator
VFHISTIKDVALLAGVSPATVSRVITQKGNIASETRAKVYSAMEQVNYVPIQSQVLNKSGTISFSIARDPKEMLGNPFFSDVLCGISDAAKQSDYNVQFSLYYNIEEQIERSIRLFKKKQADGFIFTSVMSSDKDLLLKSMQEKDIPFVMIGSSMNPNIFSVHNDNIRDSYMVTKYLLDKGYRNILFLTPDLKQDVMYDRMHGYRRAIEERGGDVSANIVFSSNEEVDITKALDKVMEEGIAFDAILTMECIMSLIAMKYCQSKIKRVPEDVGILSFNNATYLDKVSPSITGLNLNPAVLGAEAFRLVYDLINTNPQAMVQKSVKLPSEIIERQSTQRTQT